MNIVNIQKKLSLMIDPVSFAVKVFSSFYTLIENILAIGEGKRVKDICELRVQLLRVAAKTSE